MSHVCLRRLPAVDARWVHYPMGKHHIGNSPHGVARARRTHKALEMDCCLTYDGVPVAIHSNRFWRDGFRYVVTERGVLVRHKYGRNKKISELTWQQVKQLRTRDRYRIHTALNMFNRAKAAGVRVFVHVKPDPRFTTPLIWDRMRRHWLASGAHLHIIGESNRRFIYPTLQQAHVTGGFETVLLARGLVRFRLSSIPVRARPSIVWIKSARWSTPTGVVIPD